MWQCYQKGNWDEQTLQNEMYGEWNWVFAASPWTVEGMNTERERTKLTFSSDSTLFIKVNGVTTFSSGWSLEQSGDLFNLESDSSHLLLHGGILLCDNLLSFNSSWVDGGDYYFERE